MSPYTTPMLPRASAQKAVLERVLPLALGGSSRASRIAGLCDMARTGWSLLQCCTAIWCEEAGVYTGQPVFGLANACLAGAAVMRRRRPPPQGGFTNRNKFNVLGDKPTQTVTCVPTSTTRPVGIWKKSVASLADLARPINSRS